MNNRLILNESIANGLDIIGDRWTLLILREAFYGRSRFEEFQQHTGASRSTLTQRLNALIEHHILYKRPYHQSSKRLEYKFTEQGLSLLGPSLLAEQWENDWRIKKKTDVERTLFHQTCGAHMKPVAVCRNCMDEIHHQNIAWRELDQKLDSQLQEIRACNNKRRKRRTKHDHTQDVNNANLASLIGDRWSILILIAAFLGTRKYDDFSKQLNIPPSILSERLKYLSAAEIIVRQEYQNNPPRHHYTLTAKGRSLFPFIMSLRQWAAERVDNGAYNADLIHTGCGQSLIIDVVCDGCKQKPWPNDLRFKLNVSEQKTNADSFGG